MFRVDGIALGLGVPTTTLICLIGLSGNDWAVAEKPARSSAGEDPAEAYIRAYQQLSQLNDERTHQLGACNAAGCWVVTTPLDPSIDEFVDQLHASAELARHAATLDSIAWPTSVDRIQRARIVRTLSGMLALSSRKAFAENRHVQGIDDLMHALAVARHGAADSTFFAKMVEIGASRPPREVLAQHLPGLPSSVVETLPRRLAALPHSPSMAGILTGEYQWGLNDAATKGPALNESFKSLEPLYLTLADDASLPPAAFSALLDRELHHYRDNFLASALAPAIVRIRESVAAAEASEALLLAGIRVVLEGPSAVDQIDDPFGDGPITLEPSDHGFELSSRLLYRDRPVLLKFGPKK